jgi:hypothetical protein
VSKVRNVSRKSRSLQRKINTRKERATFLIVCEGEKTEPNYFRAFHGPIEVKAEGYGYNTISLVRKAIEVREKEEREHHKYDQVWCVFDKNSFSDKDFNEAIILAKKHKIKSAYSNEAFELWYLLHFSYHQAGTSRNDYGRMLSEKLNFNYRKNHPGMHEELQSMQADAIRHADMLLKTYNPHNPAKDNPCTTVHVLVQELLKSGPVQK